MLRKPGMEGIFFNIITGIKKNTSYSRMRFSTLNWSYFLKGKIIIVVDAMASIKKEP